MHINNFKLHIYIVSYLYMFGEVKIQKNKYTCGNKKRSRE